MRRVANIILELTAWSWIIGVAIAIVMTLSSCASTNNCPAYASVQCENCDEVD